MCMIKLSHLLNEDGSEASEEAHRLGLTSAGWGYWKDKSGKTVARTVDGKLVKLSSEEDEFNDENLKSFADDIKDRFGLKSFILFHRKSTDDIELASIIVPKEKLGQGLGSKVMKELIKYADKHGKRITLTPAQKSDYHGTTSQRRLINFYKQFGFVMNKGRNKDFRISDMMYREPSTQK